MQLAEHTAGQEVKRISLQQGKNDAILPTVNLWCLHHCEWPTCHRLATSGAVSVQEIVEKSMQNSVFHPQLLQCCLSSATEHTKLRELDLESGQGLVQQSSIKFRSFFDSRASNHPKFGVEACVRNHGFCVLTDYWPRLINVKVHINIPYIQMWYIRVYINRYTYVKSQYVLLIWPSKTKGLNSLPPWWFSRLRT